MYYPHSRGAQVCTIPTQGGGHVCTIPTQGGGQVCIIPTQEGRTCLYYPHSKQREKLDGLKETILPLEGELEGVGQLIQSISYIIT